MNTQPERPVPPPLLPGSALWLLLGAALISLLALWPIARGRLHQALLVSPSSLSIRYLELGILQHPEDVELRMSLVQRLSESGQLARAQRMLAPLLAAKEPGPRLRAQFVGIELDLRAWAAVPATDVAARERLLEQLLSAVRALEPGELSVPDLERCVALYRQLDQPLTAAGLLDDLARRGLPDASARIAQADAAWLAAERPAQALALQLFAAETSATERSQHLRLAVERAQSSGDAELVWSTLERVQQLAASDQPLREYAVSIAESYSVERALQLASELSHAQPNEPKYHRTVARLAEATGQSLRALDEYVWLVRHGGVASERARALELAKANWDLVLVRELLEGRSAPAAAPMRRGRAAPTRVRPRCDAGVDRPRSAQRDRQLRQVRERIALDEALGDDSGARRKLTAAVATELGESAELWQQKFELEYTVGDWQAALGTARGMLARFGRDRQASERVAQLELALGDPRAALQTLLAVVHDKTPPERAWLQRIASLAFHVGDVSAERHAYEQLIALAGAERWEYQRLYELAPDTKSALAVALATFERFESLDTLMTPLAMYEDAGQARERFALIERAGHSATLRAEPDYWRMRISAQLTLASEAQHEHHYALAKTTLLHAERSLLSAEQHAQGGRNTYAPLWLNQRAQALSLGLESDDVALTARAYADYHAQLNLREQVYVLQKLGRRDEALALARRGLARSDLSQVDRAAIELDARALTDGRESYARVSGDITQMAGLSALTGSAAVAYTGAARGLRGQATMTQYQRQNSADIGLHADARDVLGALQGRVAQHTLELGVRVRDERSARPFGSLGLQLFGKPDSGVGALLRAHVNVAANDTARLRALGVRDALELELALPFAKALYVSARTVAETYHTREERSYLGAGLSLDAGVGANVELPGAWGVAGMRLVGRVAPRFARSDRELGPVRPTLGQAAWLADGSEWAGVGASLGRGSLARVPLIGREFCYVLDGAAGWLWPASGVGYSARAGVGFSVLGADLLTLAASGGNVVGSSVWGANIGYGVSFDR